MDSAQKLRDDAIYFYSLHTTPSPNASSSIGYLAEHHPELLQTIISQSEGEDRTLWRHTLQNNDVREAKSVTARDDLIEAWRCKTVLLREARKHYLAVGDKNPDWSVNHLCSKATLWCSEGELEHSSENLHAALYAGVITKGVYGNHGGHNNETLTYMARHLDAVAANLHMFGDWLSLPELEAVCENKVHISVRDGFL